MVLNGISDREPQNMIMNFNTVLKNKDTVKRMLCALKSKSVKYTSLSIATV